MISMKQLDLRKRIRITTKKRTEDRNIMSIIIENEYEGEINIPYEKIAHEVIEAAIDYVDCPYECEVNLMLTDNETIHAINKEQREIDRPTDVLSFPMAEYEEPADFQRLKKIRWHLIRRAVNFCLEIS